MDKDNTYRKVIQARELLEQALKEGIGYDQFQSAKYAQKAVKKAVKELQHI